MGATPPYLYQPPSHQGSAMDPTYTFDPKAVTRASWSTVSLPKPQHNGPLIDFNKHPDSHVTVPYTYSNPPIFSSRSMKAVIATRWIQFGLRLLQLIGALGLLVCVICLRGIADAQSWILRIPPAWDACISVYGIIHLFRPAGARTPLSSSTYHVFCLFMDLGLLPFMALNAFWSEHNWSMATGADGRWHSFFTAQDATSTLLFVTWVAAVSVGGLHLTSAGIDVYLILIFRKIAQYPPDASPFEDHKTSAATSKHKYKNSETLVSVSEKKLSNMSGSTLALSRPTSQKYGKDQVTSDANARPISFYQSRTKFDHTYSGHTQDSAAISRTNLYQQPKSAHTSHTDVDSSRSHARDRSRSRPRSQGCSSMSQSRNSYLSTKIEHDPMPNRPSSGLSSSTEPSRYGTPLATSQTSVPTDMAKQQQKDPLLNDNWYVFGDDEQGDLSSPSRTPQPWARNLDEDYETREVGHGQRYLHRHDANELLPEPLKMHPPSPPQHRSQPYDNKSNSDADTDDGAFYFSDMPSSAPVLDAFGNSHSVDEDASNSVHNSEGTIGRALTISSAISAVSSLYSQGNSPDLSRATTPRRKAYGSLEAATQNIRGLSPGNAPQPPPKHPGRWEDLQLQRGHMEKGGRVISRSGIDLADSSVMYLDNKNVRGRQVSGKVAEEGMGGVGSGWWGSGFRKREVSGTAC